MTEAASTVLDTLSHQDSISVLLSRSTYYTEKGQERAYQTENLICQSSQFVPVTAVLKNKLKSHFNHLMAEGGSNHR